jgi:hypothetical protein
MCHGEGSSVTSIQDEIVNVPGQPMIQCDSLEEFACLGFVPEAFCGIVPAVIRITCGCEATGEDVWAIAPTAPLIWLYPSYHCTRVSPPQMPLSIHQQAHRLLLQQVPPLLH